MTPIFSSSSRILVQHEHKIILGDGLTASNQSTNYLTTQCELIKSGVILSSVAALPEIRMLKTFGESDPQVAITGGISASVGLKDDLITVSFESPYATDAAEVVNAVVDSYKTFYAASERSRSAELREILEKEEREREGELAEKTKEVLAFREANPELYLRGETGNVLLESLGKMSDALTTTRLELLDTKAAYEAANWLKNNPKAAVAMSQVKAATPGNVQDPLAIEIALAESQLTLARRRLGPQHETVEALQDRLSELYKKKADLDSVLTDAGLASLQQKMISLEQREKELSRVFADQQKKALGQNTVAARFASIESERARLEKLCDLIYAKIKEIHVNAEIGTRIGILEYARPANSPIKPKPSTVLLQALFVGLVIGAGFSQLREWMDQRLTSAEEIRAILGLEILSTISHMYSKGALPARGRKAELEPTSETAEAFRALRTAIYFRTGKMGKTILITSPEPGDGKTTTASNLAIVMAQAGQKVVIVDADCRRPSQHLIFGLTKPQTGISTVVTGASSLDDSLHATSTEGLSLLPCGPIPTYPAELLNSEAFLGLLQKLEERFDLVVIDSTPVMSVTDACIVAAVSDVTVLVLRADSSKRRSSIQSRDLLQAVGAKILGVVVNNAPTNSSQYGYAYRYKYRYHNVVGEVSQSKPPQKALGAG
jgi:capsular exopolysaccharide synthesis family protein